MMKRPPSLLKETRQLARRVLLAAGSDPIQAFVRIKRGLLARFTDCGVHQSGFQDLLSYTVRCLTPGGPVYVESNDVSDEGIQNALDHAFAKAGEALSFETVSKRRCPKVAEYFPLDLEQVHEQVADAVGMVLKRVQKKKNQSAHGYYSAYERLFFLADSNGLELFHPATAVRFAVTIIRGSGKGYATFYHPDFRRLNVGAILSQAEELAECSSRSEISLEAGEYECIFSPRAFFDFIEPLKRHFDFHLAETRKSVFWDLIGKQVFSSHFTLSEDVAHSGQFGIPFDAEGIPKKRAILIENGVLTNFLSKGHSTRGWLEHPFYPQNLVVEKGRLTFREMVKRVRRGIFINKIWYHTLVRENRMEVTGLPTAGSFYVENGEVKGRIVNARYHDSIFAVLRSVVDCSKEQILLKDGEMGASFFPYVGCSRLRIV